MSCAQNSLYRRTNTRDRRTRSNTISRDSGRQRLLILLGPKNIKNSLPTTECLLIASTGDITVRLILRLENFKIISAPALVPILHTRKAVGVEIAGVLAYRDGQIRVSTRWAYVLLEDWRNDVIGISTLSNPDSGRQV